MKTDVQNKEAGLSLLGKFPLFLFALITAVFFITGHDIERTRGAGTEAESFITSEEQAQLLLAQFESGQWINAATYVSLGLISFIGMLAFHRFRPVGLQKLYGRLAVFFFLWCLLSGAWSFQPALTANKLAIFVMLSLAAVFAAQRFRTEDLILFVIFSSTIYLAIGVAAELAWGTFRPWASGYRFSGTIHPNGQGMNCALLFLACLFAIPRVEHLKKSLLLLAVVALIFLVFTKSRTPFAVSFVCLGLYALLWSSGSLKMLLALGVTVVLLATPVFYPVLGPLFEKIIMLGRTETTLSHATQLSGRTELWQECWYYIQQRLLLGWGYNSFWTLENTEDVARQIDWYSGSAHSVYLDLWLGVGIFGMLAYVLLLIGGLIHFARLNVATHDPAYGFAFVLLLFSALHGIFESAFLYPAIYTFIVMMLMARVAFFEEPDAEREIEPMAGSEGNLAAAR